MELNEYCKKHNLYIYEITENACETDIFFSTDDPEAYVDDTEPNIYLELIDESNPDNLKKLASGNRTDIIAYLKTRISKEGK